MPAGPAIDVPPGVIHAAGQARDDPSVRYRTVLHGWSQANVPGRMDARCAAPPTRIPRAARSPGPGSTRPRRQGSPARRAGAPSGSAAACPCPDPSPRRSAGRGSAPRCPPPRCCARAGSCRPMLITAPTVRSPATSRITDSGTWRSVSLGCGAPPRPHGLLEPPLPPGVDTVRHSRADGDDVARVAGDESKGSALATRCLRHRRAPPCRRHERREPEVIERWTDLSRAAYGVGHGAAARAARRQRGAGGERYERPGEGHGRILRRPDHRVSPGCCAGPSGRWFVRTHSRGRAGLASPARIRPSVRASVRAPRVTSAGRPVARCARCGSGPRARAAQTAF